MLPIIKLWNYLTFSHLNKVLKKGHCKLEPKDYDPILPTDESQVLSSLLLDKIGQGYSLPAAIFHVFKRYLFIGGVCFFTELTLKIAEVFVLSKLINWFSISSVQDYREGYMYSGILVSLITCHAFLRHRMFYDAVLLGMRVKVAITASIYRKCLNLSISHTASTGKITNLIANDVQKFEDAAIWIHCIWIAPVELTFTWLFIFYQIGWTSIVPLCMLIFLFFLLLYLAGRFGLLRVLTVCIRDEWIKNVSDLIAGIGVVKQYAWEDPFSKKIDKLRDDELEVLRKGSYLTSFNSCLLFSSSAVLGTATLLAFHYQGGVLSPSIVFSILTLLNMTRITVFADFPRGAKYLYEANVSVHRVQAFLQTSQIKKLDQTTSSQIICLKNAHFAWEADEKPKVVLKNLNFHVNSGELIGISGPVASGKSSILNAIMGEMILLDGIALVQQCKIAYINQNPWIMPGSILHNIIFGSEHNIEWFKTICTACCLDKDFDNFPEREYTIIGERGMTLSGGQRARIALARVMYSNADLFLLDDPLSAVDSKVGMEIFERCIKGLLKTKVFLFKL
jgi:ATP-binding cassette subfamily C (CFTR/MRP) protein 4